MLEEEQSIWNNNKIKFDAEEFNWNEYWLKESQKIFPEIINLETLHTILDPYQINELVQKLQKISLTSDFVEKIDNFCASVCSFVSEEFMIQKSINIRIVIPNQEKAGRLLSFHKDGWVGNGMGVKNIWVPITNPYDSNSLQILSHEDSDNISKLCLDQKWSSKKIQQECRKLSIPLDIDLDEAFLFSSNNIHGNVNNDTDVTRVSMDFRILIKGESFYKKLPAGYFRMKGDSFEELKPDLNRTWVTYAGWNSKYTESIPVYLQRDFMNRLCNNLGIKSNDYKFELEFMDWFPELQALIEEPFIEGIVMYSLYALPDNPFTRHKLLKSAIDNGTHILFANEDLYFKDDKDLNKITRIFQFYENNKSILDTLGHI
jgi:sporadic carbohydrate cluster 2OG-Fe(II) oxygenase/sporadic carbohydrate cluster protein (TIGR04323 family)